jgi:NDP-sugar pyrophosphorylase family protein
MAHVVENQFWRELGTLDGYMQVHQELFHMHRVPLPGLQVNKESAVHPSARLGSGVRLGGMVSIGARCALDTGAVVENSVLWDQVQVRKGCLIKDSIVGDRVIVREPVSNAVVVG